jgi:hypothetical protein
MDYEFSHHNVAFTLHINWTAMEWSLLSGKELLATGTTCGQELHDDHWRGYLAGNDEARNALLDAARNAAMGAEA